MLSEAQSFWPHTEEISQVIPDQAGKDDHTFVVQLLSFVQLFETRRL